MIENKKVDIHFLWSQTSDSRALSLTQSVNFWVFASVSLAYCDQSVYLI